MWLKTLKITNVFTYICLLLISIGLTACFQGVDEGEKEVVISRNQDKVQSIDTGKSIEITNISMMDSNDGWTIHEDSLLRTENGGESWENVSPRNVSLEKGQSFFLNAETAWVIDYDDIDNQTFTTYRTMDGGKTWSIGEVIKADGQPQIYFVDSQQGWMMIHNYTGLTYDNVDLYHTKDGGMHWAKIAETKTEENPDGTLPLDGIKDKISFKNHKTGWISGYMPDHDEPWIYLTHDGGKTWNKQVLTIPDQDYSIIFTDRPLFFNSEQGILTIHADGCNDKACTYFMSSMNGGETWELKSTFKYREFGFVYDFVSSEVGWATEGTQLYFTKNGMKEWIKLGHINEITDEMNSEIFAIDFVDPNTGWMVIKTPRTSRLYSTSDGGKSWVKIQPRLIEN